MKVYLAYPLSFLISVVLHPMLLVLNIYLFQSIYAYNGTSHIKGYDLTQMIWYYGVTNFVWILTFNFVDRRMSNYILSGELGPLLLRPFSLFRYELATAIAGRATGVLLEFIPDMIVYWLIIPPTFMTWFSFVKFLTVIILAFFLQFLINFLIGISAMITQNNNGLKRVNHAFLLLLGGTLIPLDFFPEWLRRICDALPFKYIFYEPIRVFVNHPDTAPISVWIHIMLMQLLWIAGLYVAGRIIWALLIKKVIMAGG
jgi:ABC-2 type transport system permease protein